MDSYIEVRFVPLTHVLYVEASVSYDAIVETLQQKTEEIRNYLQMRRIMPTGPPFARYVDWREDGCVLQIGLPVPMEMDEFGEIKCGEIGDCEVAFAIHTGPYEDLCVAHQAIRDWIDAGGQEVGGPPWEVYMAWPATHPDPSDWKTELYWPLA